MFFDRDAGAPPVRSRSLLSVLPEVTPTPAFDPLSRAALRATVGLALATLLFRYAAIVDYRLGYIALPLVLLAIWTPRSLGRGPLGTCGRVAAAALALALVARLAIASRRIVPSGWDPSFHLFLAARVRETHHLLSDWQPWAPISLNYPLTPHVLLAAISTATGAPLTTVFSLSIATLTVLLSSLVYALSQAWPLPPRAALAATVTFTFSCWLGSAGYMDWGGLPNLLGTCFLLAALTLITARTPSPAAISILLAATLISHHHVMLTAAALLLAILLLQRRTDLLRPIALALLLSAVHWLPFLARAGSLGRTTVVTYVEEPPTPLWIFDNLGPGLSLALLAWALLRPKLPRAREPLTALLVLLALWLALDPGCRLLSRALGRPTFTPFTPSRFLTDATPLLALLAGAAIAALPRRAYVPALLLLSLPELPHAQRLWSKLTDPALNPDPVTPAYVQALAWVRDHAPPDAVIFNAFPNHNKPLSDWMPYLSSRAALIHPIPTSEPLADLPDPWVKIAAGAPLIEVLPNREIRPAVSDVLFQTGPGPRDIAVVRLRLSR
jgi:hypothetical protein